MRLYLKSVYDHHPEMLYMYLLSSMDKGFQFSSKRWICSVWQVSARGEKSEAFISEEFC